MKNFLLIFFASLLSSAMFGQLSGSYNIPGDYATLRDAFLALNAQGVGGTGATFNVAAGHTETTTDSLVLTASGRPSGSLIFQKTGSGNNPVITRSNAGFLTPTVLGGQGDAIIILQGSDYVIFNGIDVTSGHQGIEYGYYLRKADQNDGCKNVTITNCSVTMTKGTSAFVAGIYSSNNDAASLVSSNAGIFIQSTGGRSENVTITGNTISSVVAGILLRGYSHTSAPYDFYDQNFVVGTSGAGNTIRNFGGGNTAAAYGVLIQNHTSPVVSYNTIDNAGGGINATGTVYGIYYVPNVASLAGGNFLVDNNTLTFGQGATSAVYGIYTTQACNSITITANKIGFGTFASTTASYLIYASTATNNVVVSHNETTGTISKTGSGTLYCYYNPGGPTGGVESIFNNIFSNITVAGTSGFYGIYSVTSATQSKEIYSNTIKKITCGSGIFYGIYSTYGLNANIYLNKIDTVSGAGTIYGIQAGGTSSVTCNTYENRICALSSIGASSVYGIYATVATTNNIYKNNIYNLQAGGVTGTVAGIYCLSGTNLRFYNNFISDLRAPISSNVNAVVGINFAAGTNASVLYNTIFLNASSSAATFGSSGLYAVAAVGLDLRNNILVNKSNHNGNTGYTVALRRSGVVTGTNYTSLSNTNNLYASSSASILNYLFWDGTTGLVGKDSTIAAFKTRVAPRDAGSFTEDSPFANSTAAPFDLHMQLVQTKCESGATEVASPIAVTDDFDGNPRFPNPGYPDNGSYPASSPDVGADEFAGIPVFTCTAPSPGNTVSTANDICFGQSVTLSLQNAIAGTGNSFQWQQSPDNVVYTNILNAVASTFTVTPTTGTWYRCLVTCQNGPATAYSTPLFLNFLYQISSSSGEQRCGTGTVKLNATGTGTQLGWYATIVGGLALAYGTEFTTPVISETTNFYAGAESIVPATITVGSGSTTSATYSNPFYSAWSNSHNQHIVKADELIAAGLVAGQMNSLGINITVAGTLPMIDFSLKMGLTTATDLTAFLSPTFTTVYTNSSYMPTTGVNTMTFTTPFVWDGTSNLVIEICHGNSAYTVTMSRTCLANTTSYISTIHTHVTTAPGTSGTVICSNVTTNKTTYSLRPQFIINGNTVCSSPRTEVVASVVPPPVLDITSGSTVCNNVPVTLTVLSNTTLFDVYLWTPVTDLFTDAGCTLPYTGTSELTVYAKSTTPGTTTYTCTATNTTTFCSNSDTAEVVFLPGNPAIVAYPPSICLSGSSVLSVAIPNGYGAATFQWKESLDGITFTDIAGATTLSYTTPYIGQTYYYKFVTRNGAGQICTEPIYELVVQNPLVTGTTPGFHCGPGTVDLGASGTTGLLTWYGSPSGGTPLGTGPTYTTPYLWATKTYYVAALEPGTIIETAGKISPPVVTGSSLNNNGMVFNTNQYITLQSVDIYPVAATGQASVSLYSSSQTLLAGPLFFTYPAGNGITPYTLPLDLKIPAGTGYRLLITAMSGGNLARETTGITYPISSGSLVNMTSAATSLTGTSTTVYNWFYNWRVVYGCASPLTPVLATINLGPFYVLTPDMAVCNDQKATITVENGTSYFDTFTWSPADHLFTDAACTIPYVLGTNTPTVYLKTAAHGNYPIYGAANNTVNGCTNFDTTHVAVLPASVTIVSDPDTLCISGTAALTLAPAMDYGASVIQWQSSADNNTFTDITGATNASYTTGVLTATTYYKVIIKNSSYVECLSAQKSVFVDSPAITGTTPGTRCGTGTVDLGATASAGASIKWYGNISGGALLGTGEAFTTPVISTTTNFYVSAGGASGTATTFAVPNRGATVTNTGEAGLLFDVYAPSMTLEGVNIYPVGTGEGVVNIALKNSVNQVLESISFTCTGTVAPGVKTYVPLNWTISGGYGYYLDMTSRTGLVASLIRDSQADIVGGPFISNPYCTNDGLAKITSGRLGASGTSTSYYYFYDWSVKTGCTSPRVPVLATVNPGNPVNITPSRTICQNEVHTLTVTSQVGDYDVYNWSPTNNLFTDAACTAPYVDLMNLSTVYFKSSVATSVTYTCHGINTLNGCNSSSQTTVTAIPNPAIVAIPEAICISGTATLKLSPATGYGIATFQWQDSPDNSVFTDIPGATNPTYTTPTVSAVSYYKVTIKNSLGVICSEPTYTLNVGNPVLVSTTPGERCGPGTVVLGANGTGGTVKWYSDAIGGLPLGTGSPFTTPFISATTSYFAAVASPGSADGYVGMPASVSGSSGAGTTLYGLYFNAVSAFTLRSVNVYPNSSTNNTPGTVTISVLNSSGTVLHQAVVNVTGYIQSSNPNMQTVNLDFNIMPGENLRLVMTSKSSGISGLMYQPSSQAPFPYPYTIPGVVSITSGTYGSVFHPELYYYFYNWRVTVGCESPRVEVLASVNVPPDLTLSGSKTICINEVYQLNVTNVLAQFDTYTWSPVDNLFTNAACTVPYVALTNTPTVYVKSASGMITTYTCAALNLTTLCTNFTTATVTVIPSATITSTPAEICYSGTATLGILPAAGYGLATFQWQDSPNNTVFTDIPGATNPTFVTPTLSTTRYYKMLIKNETGTVCTQPVYAMTVNHPGIVSTIPATRCGIGSVVLRATAAEPSSTIKWYTAASGGNVVGTGSPFTTPSINATTTFYVSAAAGGGGVGSVGPATNTIGGGGAVALTYHLYFDVLAPSMNLHGVYVYPGAAGNVTLYIANSSGTELHTVTYPVTAGDIGNKTFIPIDFVIPNGTNYRLGYNSITGGGVSMFRNTDGAVYPYTMPEVVSITGNSFSGYPQYYYYFYDWQITTGCESARTPVVATVTPPPALTTTASPASVCAGGQSMIKALSLSFGYSYSWQPGNLNGPTQYVNPMVSTQYTVTATDAFTGCVNMSSVNVTVVPTPTPVTITPAAPAIEPGAIQQLSATGGTLSANGVFGTATTTNTTTGYPAPYTNYYGGTKHQMLIKANELAAAGLYAGALISSLSFTVTAVGASFTGNLSNFQIDMGLTTQAALTSSAFIGGLTNVLPAATKAIAVGTVTHTLAVPFVWDGLKNIVIQTSYSNGNTGSSLYSVQMTNSNPGFVSTNWYRANAASAAAILAAGTPTSSGSARPNIVIGYGTPTTMTWAPFAELYSNAAATIPYAGESLTTVWTKPAATKTYTATATTATTGCTSSGNVTVTVNQPVVPANISLTGIVHSGQSTCFNATQTITVAGNGTTFVVQSDANAIMIAGHNILYLPGTTVEPSGYMHGYITTTNTYCGAKSASIVAVQPKEEVKPFISSQSAFKLYPNPTSGEFTLEIAGGTGKDKVDVEIYGLRGDKVLTTSLEGQSKYKLSLAGKPVGVYFMRVISGGITETLKIVKE